MNGKTLGFVPYGTGEHKPFDKVYQHARRVNPADIAAGKIDALVIWGGADISPAIYKQRAAPWCHAEDTLSHRDSIEVAVCNAAIDAGVPIIGVCRGAQLLCALAGGKLVQHTNNHHNDHEIETDDGRTMITSSIHHQMMYPFDVKHKLIAWSKHPRGTMYLGEHENDKLKMDIEPEVVYFPEIKGLAIQGHPEFMDEEDEFVIYCNQLIEEYLV